MCIQVKVELPKVIHTPLYRTYSISKQEALETVSSLGFSYLYPGVHKQYFYTDIEGCAGLLPDLILKSDLYETSIFTCINYSFNVWLEASKRYGLNTWIPVIGKIPGYSDVRHAWNLILLGDETGLRPDMFLFFEPNEGFTFKEEIELAYQAFPVGEEGYQAELVFL